MSRSAPVLDARGARCPVPVARTRARLAALPEGAVIHVLADDPMVLLDMQAFCAGEGHTFLGHTDAPGGGWTMRVRKGASP